MTLSSDERPILITSPLRDAHVAAGAAAFTEFAGWEMPVRYGSDLAEHHAVRERAGLFDLSHMAELRVSGPDALELLEFVLAGAFASMPLWRAKYSLLLNERGRIVDDLIVYRVGASEYLVVANASNRQAVRAQILAAAADKDVDVRDETEQLALLALQGPLAEAVLQGVDGIEQDPELPIAELRYYRSAPARFRGESILVARTGYTGEDGFELFIDAASGIELWDAIVQAGGDRVSLCGLACRDTLRLEAGMPLYGHELDTSVTPAQAGLGRVVAPATAAALTAGGLDAPEGARVLVGLSGEGRRAPRAGYPVLGFDDSYPGELGVITSGALSPTLGHPIAMAYVAPEFSAPGTPLVVDVRGSRLPVTVTALPFYHREKDHQ